MSKTWRLLISPPARGAWNMAVDEAMLEHVGRGKSLPTLRLYAWEPPCLSLGYAQPFADVDTARLEGRGWDVVRRPTGGRAILHTDELTYSITAPLDEPRVAGSVLESYNRLAAALLKAVQLLDVPVAMTDGSAHGGSSSASPRGGNAAPGPVCFEVPSAYEITVNGKKLIGSAQARRRDGVLQHGTLPLSGDLGRITEALVFADEELRAHAALHLLERATTVETALGSKVSPEAANEAFVRAFESELGIVFQRGELAASEIARAEELVHEKYAHPSGTRRV
jgi:lipoate-protein ligase A